MPVMGLLYLYLYIPIFIDNVCGKYYNKIQLLENLEKVKIKTTNIFNLTKIP
jgi:hypothetical protein